MPLTEADLKRIRGMIDKRVAPKIAAERARVDASYKAVIEAFFTGLVDLSKRVDALEGPDPDPEPSSDFLPKPEGLTRIFYDPCTNPDPIPLWGNIRAQSDDRHQHGPVPDQRFPDYRRMIVHPTDEASGAAAALGNIDSRARPSGPQYAPNGGYYYTRFWMRLPANHDFRKQAWFQPFEMKQSWPWPQPDWMPPRFEFQLCNGLWHVITAAGPNTWQPVWTGLVNPADIGPWIPISVEGDYYGDDRGWMQAKLGSTVTPTLTFPTQRPSCGNYLQVGPYMARSYPTTWIDFAEIEVWHP